MEPKGITRRIGSGLPTMPYDTAGRPSQEQEQTPEPTTKPNKGPARAAKASTEESDKTNQE